MTVTLQMILTVCPLVLLASTVDAIAGGGGLISLPAYSLTGFTSPFVYGSNKFSASFGTLMATVKFLRGGKLLVLPALYAVAGALPGSYVGAELVQHVPEQFLKVFMLVMIPLVALVMLLKRDMPQNPKPITRRRLVGCLFIGLGCGFYDGFFGPGTGMFLIMLFTWVIGMDMVTASGTAKLVNLASNLAALVSFLRGGYVVFQLVLPAMACSVVGGYLGAYLALRIGSRFIRMVMLGVMGLLMIKLALDFFGSQMG